VASSRYEVAGYHPQAEEAADKVSAICQPLSDTRKADHGVCTGVEISSISRSRAVETRMEDLRTSDYRYVCRGGHTQYLNDAGHKF